MTSAGAHPSSGRYMARMCWLLSHRIAQITATLPTQRRNDNPPRRAGVIRQSRPTKISADRPQQNDHSNVSGPTSQNASNSLTCFGGAFGYIADYARHYWNNYSGALRCAQVPKNSNSAIAVPNTIGAFVAFRSAFSSLLAAASLIGAPMTLIIFFTSRGCYRGQYRYNAEP
jgi:hypothetical protein